MVHLITYDGLRLTKYIYVAPKGTKGEGSPLHGQECFPRPRKFNFTKVQKQQFPSHPTQPKRQIGSQNPHYMSGKLKIYVPDGWMVWAQTLIWKKLFLMVGTDKTATDSVWTEKIKKREKSSFSDGHCVTLLWMESMIGSLPSLAVFPKYAHSS